MYAVSVKKRFLILKLPKVSIGVRRILVFESFENTVTKSSFLIGLCLLLFPNILPEYSIKLASGNLKSVLEFRRVGPEIGIFESVMDTDEKCIVVSSMRTSRLSSTSLYVILKLFLREIVNFFETMTFESV